MADVFDQKLLASKNSLVTALWTELHRGALKNHGAAFSFRYKVDTATTYYRYTVHVFSPTGWDATQYYYDRDSDRNLKEAIELLKPFLSTWELEYETASDNRSENPSPGDTGRVIADRYVRFDVSVVESMRVYIAYSKEGLDFQIKLQDQYRLLLDRFLEGLDYDVAAYLQGGRTELPLFFYPQVTDTHARFCTDLISFAGLGMQPLDTIPRRYGFLVALIQQALPRLQAHGTVSWDIYPFYDKGKVFLTGTVSLRVKAADLKAW